MISLKQSLTSTRFQHKFKWNVSLASRHFTRGCYFNNIIDELYRLYRLIESFNDAHILCTELQINVAFHSKRNAVVFEITIRFQ